MTPQQEAKLLYTLERLDAVPNKLAELEGRLIACDATQRHHEKRLDRLEAVSEDTGSVYVDDLKKKVSGLESSQAHWLRYVIAVVVGLAMVFISAYIGYALKK